MLLLATFASTIIAYAAANDALTLNPPNADAHITVRGSDWLWAAFSVLLASAIGMTVLALFQPCENILPRGRRTFLFH
jgi:bacteriorhodopsin